MTDSVLHIGILIPNLHWHGGSQVAISLAAALDGEGHRVEAAVIDSLDRAPVGQAAPPVPTTYLEAALGGTGFIRALVRTRRWLADHSFDVLLAIGDGASAVGGLATSHTRHRPTLVIGSEHFPVSAKFRDFHHSRGRILGEIMRQGYQRLDGTVCVNADLQRRMIHELHWPPLRCPVIHNPVRLPLIDPSEASRENAARRARGEDFVVATAGALEARKDLPTLLRAFTHVALQVPARLRIAGTGSEKESLELLANQLGIEERVEFVGAVTDMAAFLRSADVFAFSSTAEAFGLVIIEALSQGVPVASTDCRSGPSEILTSPDLGRLAPVGDDYALGQAIIDLLTNPPNSASIVARARDFTPSVIANQYLAFFARLRRITVEG